MLRFIPAVLFFCLWLAGPALAQAGIVATIPLSGISANVTASSTFTTGTSSATLAGVTNKLTYICGFTVTSAGTTAAIGGTVTVTGTVSGTMSFQYAFVSSGQGVFGISFSPGCIQSSNINTAIVVNVPAGGAGTAGAVTAWGFVN